EVLPLSLPDALPIWNVPAHAGHPAELAPPCRPDASTTDGAACLSPDADSCASRNCCYVRGDGRSAADLRSGPVVRRQNAAGLPASGLVRPGYACSGFLSVAPGSA